MSDFHRLVEEQIPRLRRYARALTRQVDRADDLLQDTLLRAISKADLWQPGTNIRAWLFRVMHNQYINDVRRNIREGTVITIDNVSSPLAAITDPSASRQLRELDRAMAMLAHEQREAVLLIGLEGLAYQQAAEILGIPIGTVRSRLSRARSRLRDLLGMASDREIGHRRFLGHVYGRAGTAKALPRASAHAH